MPDEKDYYALLDVPPDANRETIREAFLHQALLHHPDRGGTHEKMVEICEAVEILGDPEKRALYDRARRDPRNHVVVQEWNSVARNAAASAQQYPEKSADFKEWLNTASVNVQKTTAGRILSGLFGGLIFGAVGGLLAAGYFSCDKLIGLAIGACAGAVGGAFAAASNDPVTVPIHRSSPP